MKTYTIWFEKLNSHNVMSSACIFVSSVPGEKLAENIALALEQEDFVDVAWYEED